MNYILSFSHAAAAAVSLYIFLLHVIKRKDFAINRIFALAAIALSALYSMITAIDMVPSLADSTIIRCIIFIPLFVFAVTLLIAVMYPLAKLKDNLIICLVLSSIIIADFIIIFLTPSGAGVNLDQSSGIPKTSLTLIQLIIIMFFMATSPVILLLKNGRQSMNRIRSSIFYYLAGVLLSYTLFMVIYFTGFYFAGITLLKNPLLTIPPLFMLILTSYLLIDLRNNDFLRFYRTVIMTILTFTVYLVPVFFFLKYLPPSDLSPAVYVLIKSAVIFTYLVIAYRVLNPLKEFMKNRNLNRLIQEVNNILIPVHELKKITDMERFWSFITKDNFQGLQKGLGIRSAYFMLINRKDNGYHFTYGFGRGIEPDFLPSDSNIIKQLSSYRGIFEKSYLLTDSNLAGSENEIADFFTANNLEAAVSFRNMSDSIIGFLFLGSITGRKGYNSDIIEALEIFRIKLQSLLITGLILDEVTADQVNDHDQIVVNTIKKRILPEEMISIPGIRISSLYINNSSMGGDYVDSVRIDKDNSIIFIADTSYSGIDSALTSLELYSILHSRTMIFNSAEKVLNTMNQVLKTSRISGSYVKSSCVIASSDGNFTYSNAAFNPLMIYDSESGNISEVASAGIPLSIEMDYRYPLTSAKLREGSIGILYSDGLVTSSDSSGEPFSKEKLKETVLKFARQNPSIITREIYREYRHFTSRKDHLNDVSVVVFKKVKISDE